MDTLQTHATLEGTGRVMQRRVSIHFNLHAYVCMICVQSPMAYAGPGEAVG